MRATPPAAARVHGARRGRRPRCPAADRQREAGPAGAARPRLRGAGSGGRGPATAREEILCAGVRRGAGPDRGRRRRRLLRPRRALAARRAAGGVPARAGRGCPGAGAVRDPDAGRAGRRRRRAPGRGARRTGSRRAGRMPSPRRCCRWSAWTRPRSRRWSRRCRAERRNVADVYPLAPLQEGIFFHHLVGERERRLRVADRARLRRRGNGSTHSSAALQQVIDRHDIYRTAVVWEGLREPVQVVCAPGGPARRRGRAGRRTPTGDAVQALLAAVGSRILVDRAPLIRVTVAAEPGSGRWLALLRMHHLVQDHIDGGGAAGRGRGVHVPGGAAQLPRAAAVPGLRRPGPAGRADATSTSGTSPGCSATSTSPPPRIGLLDVRGDGAARCETHIPVDDDLAARVRGLARRLGVSPATLFHVAWARVLASLAGRDDVVFGTVLFGRMNAGAGADRVLGLVHQHAAGAGPDRRPERRRRRCRPCGTSSASCWCTSTLRWRSPSGPAPSRPAAPCSPRS